MDRIRQRALPEQHAGVSPLIHEEPRMGREKNSDQSLKPSPLHSALPFLGDKLGAVTISPAPGVLRSLSQPVLQLVYRHGVGRLDGNRSATPDSYFRRADRRVPDADLYSSFAHYP